jgi:hypothetical protein
MAKEKLQIILDAEWRGKQAVKQADSDVDRLDKGVQKAQAGWQKFAVGAGVAVGALAAVGVAAKVAFEELQRGAALDLAIGQFDKLTESIGSSADAMEKQLQFAGKGMVSNANLIAGANEIMAGKLAKTESGVVRLSAAAGALNVDMGLLAQTINNQSILRLDNMGVAAEDVVPKFNALKAAGIGVKDAFTQALTEALEAKVELLGEASETTAGKIQIMQTAWENARDAFSLGVVEGAADEIELLASNVDIATESFNKAGNLWGNLLGAMATDAFGMGIALEKLDDALSAGVISQSEYTRAVALLESPLVSAGQTLEFVNARQLDWEASLYGGVAAIEAEKASLAGADSILTQYAGATYIAANATRDLTHAVSQLAFAPFGPIQSGFAALTLTPFGPERAPQGPLPKAFGPSALVDFGDEFGPRSYRESIEASTAAMEEMGRVGDDTDNLLNNFFGGVASGAATAAEEMAKLDAASGSLFDQARRMTELDPAEFFFEQALQFGASAEKLREVLVGSGLSSVQEADEIFQRFKQLESLKAGAQAFAVQDGISFEQAFAGGAGLATADFSGATVDQSKTVDVGGVTINIQGSADPADLEMAIDSAFAEIAQSEGN